LVSQGYSEVFTDTREKIEQRFIAEEDKEIRKDLDVLEKGMEDLNPDHNVIEE
jgi:hypothetical protein